MGHLRIASVQIYLDDDELAHVHVLLARILAEGEQMRLSWVRTMLAGSGRRAVTITHQTPVQIHYRHDRRHDIDRARLAVMRAEARSIDGLTITPID